MEERIVKTVSVEEFAEELQLKIDDRGNGSIVLDTVNVNRPGLQLAGFFDYFGSNRVQVVGNAEIQFVNNLEKWQKERAWENLFSRRIPCLILSRGLLPDEALLKHAKTYGVPVLTSDIVTTQLVNKLVMYLNSLLAPEIMMHGVLMDIYGVGVLLTGKSGIGKSETALELVKRGHRLVADDEVVIKREQNVLKGSSPKKIRHFMEIRGIGIIDVRGIYGAAAIMQEKAIDIVVQMENWDFNKQYDRLGVDKMREEILGVSIPKFEIPIRPGRNLAIILESAATNYRLKSFGYDAAEELLSRMLEETEGENR